MSDICNTQEFIELGVDTVKYIMKLLMDPLTPNQSEIKRVIQNIQVRLISYLIVLKIITHDTQDVPKLFKIKGWTIEMISHKFLFIDKGEITQHIMCKHLAIDFLKTLLIKCIKFIIINSNTMIIKTISRQTLVEVKILLKDLMKTIETEHMGEFCVDNVKSIYMDFSVNRGNYYHLKREYPFIT